MKKQICEKLSMVALVATITFGTMVIAYADEIVEMKALEEDGIIVTITNINGEIFENSFYLSKEQQKEFSRLMEGRMELQQKLIEKQIELILVNDTTTVPHNIVNIDLNNIYKNNEVNAENLIDISELYRNELEVRINEILYKFASLAEEEKEKLYTVIEEVIDFEFVILETQYKFGMIQEALYNKLKINIKERQENIKIEDYF